MTSSHSGAVGMPASRARKRGRLLPLGEAQSVIRQRAATPRGRVLYRLAVPGAALWLVYHDASTAPQGLSEGLYWFRKPLDGDQVHSHRVGDFPETSLAALAQLQSIGLIGAEELSKAVDLQHPIARYYREPSPETLPLNARVDPERFFRAIRRSWRQADIALPRHDDAWDPFVLTETAAISFEGSPDFLSRAPHGMQVVFDHLGTLPPLAQDYVLERMLPRPGLGVYVDAPPGMSGRALLDWARRQLGSPPGVRPAEAVQAVGEPVRNRDDWLILCSETRLLSILKARVLWWRERHGLHRVSLQCDLVADRSLTQGQQREVSESILVWAGIRFSQLVEGVASMLGQWNPAEGSVVAQVVLRRDIPVPHVTIEERMNALLSSADEWEQLGPRHRRGVAGCLAIELLADS